MPTPLESRAALTLVTRAAVATTTALLSSLDGRPEAVRADLLAGVPDVITYYSDGSAALAADFYDDERARAGALGFFSAEPVVPDRWEKIGRAIAWATEPLLSGDGQTDKRLAEVVQLETARPYRDTITANRRRDPAAVGWRRVAVGGCPFCRMLADRGAVYRDQTARFASHTHCHCTAQPVFDTENVGEEASVVQYVASQRRPSERDRERVRSYLAENYGDT